ncbi:MAG: hypothetical protein RL071_1204 [Pseudomonadota bacterium]
MDATDLSPSRMERARRELTDLTELLRGDRVGLVIFAGGAYPRLPLTLDYGVLRWAARDSATSTLLAQGSDLGAAIDMGVQLLGGAEGVDGGGPADKALIILSDGEDQEGEARAAAERAAAAGVRIFALGVGTPEGSPIPLPEGGFKKDAGGEVVLSRLDEGLLTELARIGGGAYVRSAGGSADMRAIYADELRGRLDGGAETATEEKVWDERFQWPLALAFAALVAACALPPGRLRLPGLAPGLLLGALLLGGLSARPLWAAGEDAAVQALLQEQLAKPNDLGVAERLGEALYAAGQHRRAQEVFDGVAARSPDPAQRARAAHNAGLSAYKGGRLTAAEEAFARAVEQAPSAQAQKNLEAVQKEIAARLSQPPPQPKPPPQPGEEGEEQQPQEGQPQDGQPQEGQPQDGQPQEGQPQGGQPQEGQPQDGQPQDGQPQDGQPQDGQPQEGQPQEGQAQQGQPARPHDGTLDGEQATPPPGAEGSPREPSADDTGAPPGGSAAAPAAAPEGMSKDEAARLVDSVPEGTPRVRASRDRAAGRDW